MLNSGATTFSEGATMPSTSPALLFSFLNTISSPASTFPSFRPVFAIHSAAAHVAPAMSSTWTVCDGYLPGEFLIDISRQYAIKSHDTQEPTMPSWAASNARNMLQQR